jgi:hypothetical protein
MALTVERQLSEAISPQVIVLPLGTSSGFAIRDIDLPSRTGFDRY